MLARYSAALAEDMDYRALLHVDHANLINDCDNPNNSFIPDESDDDDE